MTVIEGRGLRVALPDLPRRRRQRKRLVADTEAARWTGRAGLALTATLAAAMIAETAGPDPSSPPRVVSADFASSRETILISGGLFLAAMVFGLAFVVGITSLAHGPRRERTLGRLASASGLLAIAMLTVYAAGFAAIAASIEQLRDDQSLVYGLFRVLSATDDASGIFIATFLAAIAYPLFREGYSPRWLATLGLVAAATRATGALDITTLGGWPFGPFMVAGSVLCLIWLGLVSIELTAGLPGLPLRRLGRRSPPFRARRRRSRPGRGRGAGASGGSA